MDGMSSSLQTERAERPLANSEQIRSASSSLKIVGLPVFGVILFWRRIGIFRQDPILSIIHQIRQMIASTAANLKGRPRARSRLRRVSRGGGHGRSSRKVSDF
jgi:hypothetical protein